MGILHATHSCPQVVIHCQVWEYNERAPHFYELSVDRNVKHFGIHKLCQNFDEKKKKLKSCSYPHAKSKQKLQPNIAINFIGTKVQLLPG